MAWHQISELRQPASFGGWLLRIARNKSLSRLARDRRTGLVGDDEDMEAIGPRAGTADAVDRMIERERDDPDRRRRAGGASGGGRGARGDRRADRAGGPRAGQDADGPDGRARWARWAVLAADRGDGRRRCGRGRGGHRRRGRAGWRRLRRHGGRDGPRRARRGSHGGDRSGPVRLLVRRSGDNGHDDVDRADRRVRTCATGSGPCGPIDHHDHDVALASDAPVSGDRRLRDRARHGRVSGRPGKGDPGVVQHRGHDSNPRAGRWIGGRRPAFGERHPVLPPGYDLGTDGDRPAGSATDTATAPPAG